VARFHWRSRYILFNGGEAEFLSFSSSMGSAAMTVAQLFQDGIVKESEKKELTYFRARLKWIFEKGRRKPARCWRSKSRPV
jgi:hypothetical protein